MIFEKRRLTEAKEVEASQELIEKVKDIVWHEIHKAEINAGIKVVNKIKEFNPEWISEFDSNELSRARDTFIDELTANLLENYKYRPAIKENFVTNDMTGLISAARKAGIKTMGELDKFIKEHKGEDIIKALNAEANKEN